MSNPRQPFRKADHTWQIAFLISLILNVPFVGQQHVSDASEAFCRQFSPKVRVFRSKMTIIGDRNVEISAGTQTSLSCVSGLTPGDGPITTRDVILETVKRR